MRTMKMSKPKKTIIHVNQHVIRSNKKNNTDDPVLTVKSGKENLYAHEAEILDAEGNLVAKVIYSPEKPLSCGARVWVETHLTVKVRQRD